MVLLVTYQYMNMGIELFWMYHQYHRVWVWYENNTILNIIGDEALSMYFTSVIVMVNFLIFIEFNDCTVI